jgi:hypothetical protein
VRESGGRRFEYRPEGEWLRVEVGGLAAPLEWTFGSGAFAYTAVGRHQGSWFEHRISWYTAPARASLTPGHSLAISSPVQALGIVQNANDSYRCFNCHATGVKRDASGADLSGMAAGIQCERCHGPGRRHAEAGTILNPGRFPAQASVEICGECHRSPKAGQFSPVPELDDPMSVRFQPVGLMASRCFRESKKLSCLTCHDPHADARRNEAAFYNAKCLACHTCKRDETAGCLGCHMQRTTPAPYLTFTDHRIRIY